MNIKLLAKSGMTALKKSSPTIMLVAGIAGMGVSTVLACKATLKVDEVLDKAQNNVKKIHEVAESPEHQADYTQQDMHKDLTVTYIQTAWGLAKLYGPAILIGGLSVFSIVGSHRIMNKRVLALSASCLALGKSLQQYRENVTERYGAEAENDIYYNIKNEKIEELEVTEDGKEKKTKVEVKTVDKAKVVSPFAVFFDISNPNYTKDDPVFNVDFISSVQRTLNDKLKRKGWVSLNEARYELGFKPVPEGQIYGWVYDESNQNCDCFIDFGIDHISRQDVRDFRNGYEKFFLIDFNVDPEPILEKIHLFDKTNRAA